MDEATLQSLLAALDASPDNDVLRALVIQAYLDRGEVSRARAFATPSDVSISSDPKLRIAAAGACLAVNDAKGALEIAPDTEAEGNLARARAFSMLGRREEGRSAYARAIADNPTLEDLGLRDQLFEKKRAEAPHGTEGRARLRVVGRDDQEDILSSISDSNARPITFADIGGLDELKAQIRRKIILPFQKPALFRKFKKRMGGGILLYGPPGCGKTLLARATAGECNAQFLNVAISDVLDMWLGESEQKLHGIFERARKAAPSVLFFDELEALAARREHARNASTANLVSQFLSEMDGFAQNNEGVLILGATNVPWAVDSAFRRPGRFDRVQFVSPPDQPARAAILELQLEGRPTSKIDVGSLARKTRGYSGADLEHLIETAADFAIEASLNSGEETAIGPTHVQQALKISKATTVEWITTARNYARFANESGQYDEVLAFLREHDRK